MPQMTYARARVRFFPPGQGGRHAVPIGEGYAPYLRTPTSQQDLAVRVNGLPEQGGQFSVPYDVELELMYHPSVDYSPVQPGTLFRLVEGPKVIGEGEITSWRYERLPSR